MTSRVSDEALIMPNFSYADFKCHCDGRFCDGYPEFIEQVEITAVHTQELEDAVSEELGYPVRLRINHGFSDPQYNATIPGASAISHHMYDMWPLGEGGIDSTPEWLGKGVQPAGWIKQTLRIMAQKAYELGWRGIKIYSGHVHLDRRRVPWLRNFEPREHIPIAR